MKSFRRQVFNKEGCSEKFCKALKETSVMEPLFSEVDDLQFSKNKKVGEKGDKNIKERAQTYLELTRTYKMELFCEK